MSFLNPGQWTYDHDKLPFPLRGFHNDRVNDFSGVFPFFPFHLVHDSYSSG